MGQTSANPYSSSSIAAYNSSPPSDDGATTTANKVEWAKHKTKLADPIKTLSEAIDSGMTTAGALLVNTATGVRNQISGSVGFAWGTATIADDSITPDSSAVQIGAESGATQDTLQNMGVGSVYDGAVLTIKALSATEEILVIHATSTLATHASANLYLAGATSYLIDDQHKTMTFQYDSQTASGFVETSRPTVAVPNDYEFVSTAAIGLASALLVEDLASGYDYIIQLEAFGVTDEPETLWMRFSDDGTTIEVGAADYDWGLDVGGSPGHSNGDTKIVLSNVTSGNDAGTHSSIQVTLPNAGGSSEPTTAYWSGFIQDTQTGAEITNVNGGGTFKQGADPVIDVQFSWSAGSTFKAQGDISVWRRKRS